MMLSNKARASASKHFPTQARGPGELRISSLVYAHRRNVLLPSCPFELNSRTSTSNYLLNGATFSGAGRCLVLASSTIAGANSPPSTATSTNGALTLPVAPPARAPPSVASPSPTPPATLPPPKIYEAATNLGVAKANLSCYKILTLGVLAGVYIGFGSFLALSVGGACPGLAATNPGLQKIITGAFGLPFGLLMVLICGGELFTGNTALVTTALHEQKISVLQLAKSWSVSYLGNLAGSLALVGCVVGSGLMASAAAPVNMAVAKTSLTFTEAFFRGVLCNWLVCIAIWQCTAAKGLASKAIAVWFPISSFIALGLEHCVANMFIVPLGIMVGAPVTWAQFFSANLLPVTLGNIVGGALCVATAYAGVYGRLAGASK